MDFWKLDYTKVSFDWLMSSYLLWKEPTGAELKIRSPLFLSSYYFALAEVQKSQRVQRPTEMSKISKMDACVVIKVW
jgi:hypothetical protein